MANGANENSGEKLNPPSFVEYCPEIELPGGQVESAYWCVIDPTAEDAVSIMLWGFATKIDAEIAAKFMDELEPDYTLESPYFWWQFEQYGGSREGVMKAACERLRW